jgi:hypothetical protein
MAEDEGNEKKRKFGDLSSKDDDYALSYSDEEPSKSNKIHFFKVPVSLHTTNRDNSSKTFEVSKNHSIFYDVPMESPDFMGLYNYLRDYYVDTVTFRKGLGPCLNAAFIPSRNLLLYTNEEGNRFAIHLECDNGGKCSLTNPFTKQTYVIQKGAGKRKTHKRNKKTYKRRKTSKRRKMNKRK